jgi:GGDEF domain-containing protein
LGKKLPWLQRQRKLPAVLQSAGVNGSLGLRPPRVLIVGDVDGQLAKTVAEAGPDLHLTAAKTIFEAIAALQEAEFGAVLVAAGRIENRPEAAIKALRAQFRPTLGPRPPRLVLFGPPAVEPLAKHAVAYGADDYVVLPARPEELSRALRPEAPVAPPEDTDEAPGLPLVPADLPLATIILDALTARAGTALPATIARLNTYMPTAVQLELVPQPPSLESAVAVSLNGSQARWLVLHIPAAADQADRDLAQHDLQQLAGELEKLAELDARHLQLQRLALTDDLTDCYNRRYFLHFLEKILSKAREERFPVTLLLFDIDDFKDYNDRHGHAVGDAILQQTAALIKRCVRDHDLVARIGGDEFAVIFWETEGPRVPHDPASASGNRFPAGPLQIAARFRRLMSEPDFFALGPKGKGTLSISGGMAVFPFDAQTAGELVEAADRALVFGSKRSGKNSISLVGAEPGEAPSNLESEPAAGPQV